MNLAGAGEWLQLLPQIVLVSGLLVLSLLGFYAKKQWVSQLFVFSVLVCVALCFPLVDYGEGNFLYGNFQFNENYTAYFLAGLVIFGLSVVYFHQKEAEYYLAGLTLILGLSMISISSHLLPAFLCFEIVGFSTYILSGISEKKGASSSTLQYILTGGLTTGLLLFGFSLIYVCTGSLVINEMSVLPNEEQLRPVFFMGWGFVACGLLFKMGMIPFHQWVMDVFQKGSAGPLFLISLLPKLVGVFFAFQLLSPLLKTEGVFQWGVFLLGALSLTMANSMALGEKSPMKVLGLSSIAHSGFVVVGLLFSEEKSLNLMLFYFLLYLPGLLLGLFLLGKLKNGLPEDWNELSGLAKKNKFYGIGVTLSAMALAGLPPLAGFWGKFYFFVQALELASKNELLGYSVLAVLVLNTVLAFGYYLKFPYFMFLKKGEEQGELRAFSMVEKVGAGLLMGIVLLIFLLAEPLIDLIC